MPRNLHPEHEAWRFSDPQNPQVRCLRFRVRVEGFELQVEGSDNQDSLSSQALQQSRVVDQRISPCSVAPIGFRVSRF